VRPAKGMWSLVRIEFNIAIFAIHSEYIPGPVFVDAPHILIPEGHSFGMLQTADSSVIPRAWWRSNDERTVYTGLNESLLYFRDVLRETRFQVRSKR
jgi:hypothetical protein